MLIFLIHNYICSITSYGSIDTEANPRHPVLLYRGCGTCGNLWKMKMSTPSLAQGSLVIIEALNGTLNEYIQDFGGFANVRACTSPYLELLQFCYGVSN